MKTLHYAESQHRTGLTLGAEAVVFPMSWFLYCDRRSRFGRAGPSSVPTFGDETMIICSDL